MKEKIKIFIQKIKPFINTANINCVLLIIIAIGVWCIYINNKKPQDVYVCNPVDTYVQNAVDVNIDDEIDVNVEHWNGWLVGSHHGYYDSQGTKHVAIDTYKNGGW